MVRLLIAGLILWPVLGLVAGQAGAATDFQDIPYLQSRINQVLEREPTGTEVEWRNQATGNAGVIRVLRTYFPSPGAPCRDYERTTRRPDGSESLVRGTGCRNASGRWGLKETEERSAAGAGTGESPETWEPAAPGGGPATGAASGPASESSVTVSGGQAGQAGGGAQGQSGTASKSQSWTPPESAVGGQAGGSGQPTAVLPDAGAAGAQAAAGGSTESETAASEAPAPAPPAPRKSASSLPEIELPTRSD